MAGLNLGVMGGVRASTGTGYQSGPMSAAEAGFGPGYSMAGAPDSLNALAPNDPFGVAFWVGVGSLALLLFVRHSLPA